jgi:hypothetical protein
LNWKKVITVRLLSPPEQAVSNEVTSINVARRPVR